MGRQADQFVIAVDRVGFDFFLTKAKFEVSEEAQSLATISQVCPKLPRR
jgi:hypothetical protein